MKNIISIVVLFVSFVANSQSSSDCEGAISICQNQTTVGANTFNNTGAINDENNASCWSGTGMAGSAWYSFSPETAGQLGFELTPTGGTDYDFALFDITNGCANMQELSCNFSLEFGSTGMDDDSGDWSDDFFFYEDCSCDCPNTNNEDCNPWNDAVTVDPTHTYVLMINYYSGSNDGFTFDFQFEPGLVSINDNIPPEVETITTPNCGENTITVDFTELVLCSSIQASDFTVTGPGGPYVVTGVDLSQCNSGMVSQVVLTLDNAFVTTGSYNLNAVNIEDKCGNVLLPPGDDTPFSISTVINPLISGNLDFCSGDSTNLTASPAGSGYSYLWSFGGETSNTVYANAAGTYSVTITTACATDNTSVLINELNCLSACDSGSDILASGGDGNYSWQEWTSVTTTTAIVTEQECIDCPSSSANYGGFSFGCFCTPYTGCSQANCTTTASGWSTYATGPISAYPSAYPIQLIDGSGEVFSIPSLASLNTCVIIALPVELGSFELSCRGEAVLIDWMSVSEVNNDYFLIEKSYNGGTYQFVGTVDGVGNSTNENFYEFFDFKANNFENTYYRLSQIDFDGHKNIIYSGGINCSNDDISIFPNPFNDEIIVELGDFLKNSNGKIEIYNTLGQRIVNLSIEKNESLVRLNTEELSEGIYVVKVYSDKLTYVERLIKK